MAKSVTILGPYSPKYFVDNTSDIASAISTAIGGNTCATSDPVQVLGNFYIIVTTS